MSRVQIPQVRRLVVAVASAGLLAATAATAPANADPGMPKCEGPLALVCGMLPAMPELDHDIDVTQQYQQGTMDTEHMPPADVCSVTCI